MITKYNEFILESIEDDIIELYSYFIKILKIHEKHFYNDSKISNDPDFNKEVNSIFYRLLNSKKEKEVRTEELYDIVNKYEKINYNDDLMTPEDNFGCSMYDVCDVLIEDPDTLNINDYIQNFSEDDIYTENYDDFNNSLDEIDDIENNLSKLIGNDDN